MKTKQSIFCGFFTVIVALALTAATLFGAAGCTNPTDPPKQQDNPKEQGPVTINLFEGNTATVKGTATDAQWVGMASKIETAINTAFITIPPGPAGASHQNRFRAIFNDVAGNKTVIIIGNLTDNYQVENRHTLHLNINFLLNEANDLQTEITAAVGEMNNKDVMPSPQQNTVVHGGSYQKS